MPTPQPSESVSYVPFSGSVRAVREAGHPGRPRPRLLDRVREAIRARHYSRRTEETYIAWIRRYILFRDDLHARPEPGTRRGPEPGGPDVHAVRTQLAPGRRAVIGCDTVQPNAGDAARRQAQDRRKDREVRSGGQWVRSGDRLAGVAGFTVLGSSV